MFQVKADQRDMTSKCNVILGSWTRKKIYSGSTGKILVRFMNQILLLCQCQCLDFDHLTGT